MLEGRPAATQRLWHDGAHVCHADNLSTWCYSRSINSASYTSTETGETLELDAVGIELLLLLDVGVCLQDLVDSLLHYSHVGHHVILCDTLGTQQVNVRFLIALN